MKEELMTLEDRSQSDKPADQKANEVLPSFSEWYDRRYGDDDGDCGGHISDRMIRRWDYDEEMKRRRQEMEK